MDLVYLVFNTTKRGLHSRCRCRLRCNGGLHARNIFPDVLKFADKIHEDSTKCHGEEAQPPLCNLDVARNVEFENRRHVTTSTAAVAWARRIGRLYAVRGRPETHRRYAYP